MPPRPSATRAVAVKTVAAVLAVVLLLAAAVGAVSLLGGDDGGDPSSSTTPEPLTLARTSTGLTPGSGPLVGGTGLSNDTTDGVVLDPSGSSATVAEVSELLAALGLDAEPVRVDGGWTAEGQVRGEPAAFALDEAAGNVWQYATGEEAECLVVRPGGRPDDAVSSCGPAGTTDLGGPPRAVLVRHAQELFDLVGVTPGRGLQLLQPGGGVVTLDVPLEVEGLPVVGINLSVSADADGLTGALGWLQPDLRPTGPYPLVSAREALLGLQAQPVPEIASCLLPTDAQGDPITDGPCATPEPTEVTDARLAWMTSFDGTRTLLVPAWQFEADGFYGPAAVAVTPDLLAPPP